MLIECETVSLIQSREWILDNTLKRIVQSRSSCKFLTFCNFDSCCTNYISFIFNFACYIYRCHSSTRCIRFTLPIFRTLLLQMVSFNRTFSRFFRCKCFSQTIVSSLIHSSIFSRTVSSAQRVHCLQSLSKQNSRLIIFICSKKSVSN